MPVYVYRIYPAPKAALLSYYDWYESFDIPAPTPGDAVPAWFIPYFVPGVANPNILAQYYWAHNSDVISFVQQPDTYTGWAKYTYTSHNTITLYLNAQANDQPEQSSPSYSPRYQQPALQSGRRYFQSSSDTPTAAAPQDSTTGWVKYTFQPPDRLIIFWSQGNDAPPALAAEETFARDGWKKQTFKPWEPLITFWSQGNDITSSDTDECPQFLVSWAPITLYEANVRNFFRLYLSGVGSPNSAPIQPETNINLPIHQVQQTYRARPWLYVQQNSDFTPVVPDLTGAPGWRKFGYTPQPVLAFFWGGGNDTSFTPAQSDVPPSFIPNKLWKTPYNLAGHLYYQSVPGPEGYGDTSEFMVWWAYQTQYEARVRDYFRRFLGGLAQDGSAPIQPDTLPPWSSRFSRNPYSPKPGIFYYNNTAQDFSFIFPEENPHWGPRFSRDSYNPNPGAFYYTNTAQDFSFQFPEENPHWPPHGVQVLQVPRSLFENLYFGRTAQDFTFVPEPSTPPDWHPQRVGSQYRTPISQHYLYQQGTDVTGITSTSTGVGVKIIARVHGLEDQVFYINIIV